MALNNLAALYKKKGDYAEARALLESCVDSQRRSIGDHNPDTLNSMNNLAGIYYDLGEYEKAVVRAVNIPFVL